MPSDFWRTVRDIADFAGKALGSTHSRGRVPVTSLHGQSDQESTPLQRAMATGHTPGYNVTQNYWENLQHMSSWSFPAIDAFATQVEGSSVCAYANKPKTVTKAHAHDAPAPPRTPIHSHPALDILERPNPVFWREIFMYQVACHYALTGGWVIWEVRNAQGLPCEYWALPRAWLTFQPPSRQFPMGLFKVFNPRGMQGYWGSNPLAGGFYIDVRDCIIGGRPHPLWPSEPLSTMTAMSRVIDICEQADLAVWTSLLESPQPGMVLLVDGQFQMTAAQMQHIRETVETNNAGADKRGKLMLLQGLKLERQGSMIPELDAVNVRRQNQEMVLGAHSTPPVAVGVRTETGSYAGDAATINTWIELHVQPFLNRFYGCLNHRNARYWPDVKLEGSAKRFDDPLLDQKVSDQLFAAIEKGAASVNEWRASMKLPPTPGGDEMRQPQPMGMVGPDGQPIPGGMPDATGMGQQVDDEFDMDLDLPDGDGPNLGNPLLSRMGGRSFAPSANGSH